MGILSRFIQVLRANLNALLSRAEHPTRMIEQALLDLEAAYRKAKDHVAHAMAEGKQLEAALARQREEVARWHQRAATAVEQGDDELAREALRRKQQHAQVVVQFEDELRNHGEGVLRLREGLRELDAKIEEVRHKKTLLAPRARRAEAGEHIQRTLDGTDANAALATIERMEHRIDELTALVDARAELRHELSDEALERRFAQLDAIGDDVDTELIELKQRVYIEHKG